jgi:hypothetical protein
MQKKLNHEEKKEAGSPKPQALQSLKRTEQQRLFEQVIVQW